MTTAPKAPAGFLPTSGGRQSDSKSTPPEEYSPRWNVIVPVVLIAAILLLVGLPLGAVYIMNLSCCLTAGPENVVTFWAAMTAGFLTLFGMIITGVFIITALRVDATARATAQVEAQNEVWTYVDRYEERLAQDLSKLKTFAKETAEKVTECGENAKQDIEARRKRASDAIVAAQNAMTDAAREAQAAIARALEDVETQQEEASSAIAAARDATSNAASQAQEGIATALEETASAATEAQEAMGRAAQEVDRQHDEAIRAIADARQRAEVAAREVRERADRGIEGTPPTEEDEPDRDE